MKNGETPYQPYSKYITVSPTSEIVTGGPKGSADHTEAVKSTPCQPLGAACDAQQLEGPHDNGLATPQAGEQVAVDPPVPRTPPPPTASPTRSSGRPTADAPKRPRTAPPWTLGPPGREPPTGLKFPVPKDRDRPPMSPWSGVIITDEGIFVKQATRHGVAEVFTKKITKITPSNRDILRRIKEKGQLERWDPKEDLPREGIDEDGGSEDVDVIFDCDDVLGPDWKGRDVERDLNSDDPTTEASRRTARKLEAAAKRVDRFNEFGHEATGLSMPWIEEIKGRDGKPTKWRIPGIFYREL
jgi:hypothetical protein